MKNNQKSLKRRVAEWTGDMLVRTIRKQKNMTDSYILQVGIYFILALLLFFFAVALTCIKVKSDALIGLVFSLALGAVSIAIRAMDVAFEAARLDIENMKPQATPITDSTELNLQLSQNNQS